MKSGKGLNMHNFTQHQSQHLASGMAVLDRKNSSETSVVTSFTGSD